MTKVFYSSPFIPPEWIAAHDVQPVRFIPQGNSREGVINSGAGVSPEVQSFVSEAINSEQCDVLILTTSSDQMRRAADIVTSETSVPVFLFNLPVTWQSETSEQIFRSELHRLSRFLSEQNGVSLELHNLSKIMSDFEAKRVSLLNARSSLSAHQFASAASQFFQTGEIRLPDESQSVPRRQDLPAVALLGGTLLQKDFDLYHLVTEFGGKITLDGTEIGERCFPARFERLQLTRDPVSALVKAYLGSISAPFRRPNHQFYQWIGSQLALTPARGMMIVRYLWDDLWHAEVQRIREQFELPVLSLDLDGSTLGARCETRIQAFLDSLQ